MENLLLDSIAEKLTMIEDKTTRTEALATSTNDSMKEVKEILKLLKLDHKSVRTAMEYMPPALIPAPTRTYSMSPADNARGFPGGNVPYLISMLTLVLAASLFSAGLGSFRAYAEGVNQKITEMQNTDFRKAEGEPKSKNLKQNTLSPSIVRKGANFSIDSTTRNKGHQKETDLRTFHNRYNPPTP